jgi:hypothetical protein
MVRHGFAGQLMSTYRKHRLYAFRGLFLLLLAAVPLHAAPRWLTAVPRAFGRTAVNMVTFRHPAAALEEWAIFGAVAADAYTTSSALSRCPSCHETSPLLGTHPSNARLAITATGLAFSEATTTQYSNELTWEGGSRWWKVFPVATAIAWSANHAAAAASNAAIP